ncbi:ABC transporter substrate-binding protein [Ruegeria marina]|uniref:Spermidine/putrescine transport system substrate-binding protein n=1 Tax=Ruegeria marina TaxID=639004 RepID=A0A1G7CWG8_9RHOB|nr:ABC transporter substrate-binding protein [Ruegeria marina]SDE42825.1 spermidine/putrescine transport system substrate-binding protein [Ruegeria marina]
MKHFRMALLMSASLVAGAAFAEDTELVVFDWAGYEDPEFFVDFTEKYGDGPTFAFFSDEEEAFQKLRAGFKADAVHPCSQSVPKWIEAGLLAPLDTSKITEWDNLEPGFRDIEAYWKDGKPYFVPVDWGNTALTYNTELLKPEDVQSLKAFADPKHAGRVSIPDNVDDAYALGFLATGVRDWTNVTDDQVQAASDFLRQVHQNMRAYWTDGASLAQMMQSGEVYLAWAWNETFSTMSAEGHPIAMKRDTDEGSSSWVCGYSKLVDAPGSEDKFYDFVNAWLAPRTADYIVSAWGYGHSNAAAMSQMSAEDLAAVGLDTSENLRAGTLWQAPTSSQLREKLIADFEKIKAGF